MHHGSVRRAVAAIMVVLLGAACGGDGSPTDDGGTGNVAGSVSNPITNTGVGGVTVRLQSTAGGSHTTTTNLAGGFTFVGVATGSWILTIDVPGGMRFAPSETGSRALTVARSKTTNTQAFLIVALEQQVGAIGGRVTAGNAGVAGAVITLPNDTEDPPSTTTDAQGNFGFANLTAGIYTVAITPPSGYQLASGEPQQRTVNVQATQTATVNWSLQAVSGAVAAGVSYR